MGQLQIDINLLVGQTVERVHIVAAETTRQSDHYLVIKCEDDTRIIIPFVSDFTSPMPNSLMALREAAKDGAFTVQEALQLAEGRPLGPPPLTKGKRKPEDVTMNHARGIPVPEDQTPEEAENGREHETGRGSGNAD